VSDCTSPSPRGGGRAEPARPPLNPPLISNLELQRYVLGVMYKLVLFLTCLHIFINFSFDIAYLAKYVCCRFFSNCSISRK